jgi:hypothetical protein
MIKPTKTLCHVQSNTERDVYAGSGFCRRCQYFNGMLEKKCISCKRPDA